MESLAVRYRPKTWEEVISQESIIKILQRQISTNQVKNSYLFSGASGCGKTTCARLFAKAVNNNQGNPIEIDAASNNGVDNVREIVSNAQERSLDSKYKIYIIDEAHALSNSAWQAFLKCIEEPPEFTIFIFCTTDPQKIPQTIQNRTMRFNFNRVSVDKIVERLEYICEKEGFTNYNDGINYIARSSNGEVRNAISILEKCASYNTDLSIDNVLYSLGNYSYDTFFSLINNIIDCKEDQVLLNLDSIYNQGNDLKIFVEQFLSFCLDLEKYCIFNDITLTHIPISYEDNVKNCVNFQDANKYYNYITKNLLELKNILKTDSSPKISTDIYFLRLSRCQ